MHIAPKVSFEDFESSAVCGCFVPVAEDGTYSVKIHADAPTHTAYMLGSLGDSCGTPENFRLLLPTPLAVGDKGTIINLSRAAIKTPYPTFAIQAINVDGYHVISPYFGAPSFRVGRLMALTFLQKPEGATDVDHIDGDPAHDELDNLEWVTHGENLRRGRHSTHRRWKESDFVLMIREGCEPRLAHPTEIASIIGSRNGSHILRRGTRKSANGWYVCLNPNRSEALDFVKNLPFQNTSAYIAPVKKLLDCLDID